MTFKDRKRNRLEGFDYSSPGAYFLTVCVSDMRSALGRIIVGDGVLDVPEMRLSEYGKVTEKQIAEISLIYDNISVEKYVVMPNHFHLLVSVRVPEHDPEGTSGTPSPTNALIPAFVSSLKRLVGRQLGISLFQRSYHDHIIRDDHEYDLIWRYIDENPLRWKQDCFYNE